MMKNRIAFMTLLASSLTLLLFADVEGTWSAEGRGDRKIQLNARFERGNMGQTVRLTELAGLSESQIASQTAVPVSFALEREAGSLHFEGTFRKGDGAGHFNFVPATGYFERLRAMGVEIRPSKESDERRLFTLAMFNVSSTQVKELHQLGYKSLSLDDLVSMQIHGATPGYIREMKALGYDDLSTDDLVAMRIHGATPEFVKEMMGIGFRPSGDELVSIRIHGVSGEFVKELRAQGYSDLKIDDVVSMRIHGVSSEFVRALAEQGYPPIAADDLTSMKIHGVSSEYIKGLAELGYKQVPADDLISMKIHGVSLQFIRDMKEAGYENVPPEKLVEMKIHGIDKHFVRSVNGKKQKP